MGLLSLDQKRIAGLLELAAQMGTSGVASLGGGLAYLPAAAMGGDKAGQAVKSAVEQAYTYQPRTEEGQRMSGMLGQAVAPYAALGSEFSQKAGDAMYRSTGSPLLAAATRTVPTAIGEYADRFSSAGGLLPKPTRQDMTAYHGSPHDFDEFSLSKIGTGEGAQAYGHGLYFAESPEVAGSYLMPNRTQGFTNRDSPVQFAKKAYAMAAGDKDKAISLLNEELSKTTGKAKSLNIELAIQNINEGRARKGLYTVDIPDDAVAKFLDWDKPLSEQPQSVMDALEAASRLDTSEGMAIKYALDMASDKGVGLSSDARLSKYGRGEGFLSLLSDDLGRAGASKALHGAGIPGIRYLDANSRSDGKGTSNFVVFDDKLIKVLKKE